MRRRETWLVSIETTRGIVARARVGAAFEQALAGMEHARRSRAPKASVSAKFVVSARAATRRSTSRTLIRSPAAQVASLSTSAASSYISSPTSSSSSRQASGSALAPWRRNCSPTQPWSPRFGDVPEQQAAFGGADRLGERGVLRRARRRQREGRLGCRRAQVGGDRLDVGRLPRLDALDEHQPSAAGEETERVAVGDDVLARALASPGGARPPRREARAQALDGEVDLGAVAAGDQVGRIEPVSPSR